MSWQFLAISAPALWALSNLIDSRLLEERVTEPMTLVVVTGVFGGLPGIFVLATGNLAWPGLPVVVLATLTGVVALLAYLPYFRALDLAPTAAVLLMWNVAPVLIVVLARVFLHEELRIREYVAIALLLASATAGGAQSSGGRRSWSPALPWMLLASLLVATVSVAEKRLFELTSFSTGLGWMSLATFSTAIVLGVLMSPTRQALSSGISRTLAAVLVANECLDVSAATALSRATSLGPVSLVHAVGGLQPLFVLVFGATVHFLRPRRYPPMTTAEYVRSVAAVAFAAIGLGLMPSFQ